MKEFHNKENEIRKTREIAEESIIWFFKIKSTNKRRKREELRDKQAAAIGGLLRLLLVIRDATVWAHIFQPISFRIVLEGAEAGPSVASEMSPLSARSTVHPVTRSATVSTKARNNALLTCILLIP